MSNKSIPANVGLFCDVFPPIMDGVSICVENYAEWMQKKVGGTVVVTPKAWGVDYEGFDFNVASYFSVPIPMRKPYVAGFYQVDPAHWFKLKDIDLKIIHAHSPFNAGELAQKIAKSKGIPCVSTFHSKYKDDFSRILPEPMVKMMLHHLVSFYNHSDLVWVPQESVIEVIRSYGYKGPVEVMDNGSDLVADYPEEYYSNARKELGVKDGEFLLLFVGQHIWEKNPQLVINALSEIKEEPFKMFFVGNGYAFEDMKKMVRQLGLTDKITFVGSIEERDEIKKYYAAADLFCFPSMYDNAPLVVREAAALRTPSIMAKGSTAATVINDGVNGYLTNNNYHDMALLLKELINSPEKVHKAGIQASRTIVRSWEDCVEEVLDRYNALLKQKGLPLIENID